MNILSVENVTISTPNGNRVVPNPLFRYRFQGQPYPAGFFGEDPLGQANTTLRTTSVAPTRDDLAAEEAGYVVTNNQANVVSGYHQTFKDVRS